MNKILNPIKFILISIWTAISGILALLFIVFSFRQDMTSFVARTIWSPGILFICGVKLKISGKENLPEKPAIFISNHESLLDIPAIFVAIPRNLFFIAKKELRTVPFMGWAMAAGGMIFIDRHNKEQAKKDMLRAGELIKKGKNIISFPEGTRTKTGEIAMFKRGTFLLSVNTGIDIIPITIDGARELLPSGSFNVKSGKIDLHISAAVSPKNYSAETVEKFAEDVRQIVVSKLY